MARSPRSARAKDYLDRFFTKGRTISGCRLPSASSCWRHRNQPRTSLLRLWSPSPTRHLTTALLHRVPQAAHLQRHPPFKPAKQVAVPPSRWPRATELAVPANNNSLRQLPSAYPPRHKAPPLCCPGLPGTSPRCEAVQRCCHPSR